ncbi:hypothetical protein ASD79_00495 [Caulobacter sp. Root655]|uniref:SWIM zinc finger family protein n=1 Tax=Caulobacter sp. Root655 TaxID=1736578 RepID=UPI0006FA3C91|nr:SWIM zinc finger family protein [Caulobacter sp. Root655]KRA65798.1 hypothetical protein ASD79_00495 [Caulobacter sp. Root655]
MSLIDTPFFDIGAWRERMDGRWFDSGVQLAEAGAVDLVAIEDDSVTAHVRGGELYVVSLRAPAGDGACTCPGFEKFGACKHQAAVVVAANLLDATGRQYVQGRLARLRDGLALESREALIERLVDLAKRDPKVLASLES